MKKLIVSGWVSFIMLIPADLFLKETLEIGAILFVKLMNVSGFKEALMETELYHLSFDDMELLSGKEILLSGDNGNIYLQLQQLDDFEVFF
jgi:hypothetical protein